METATISMEITRNHIIGGMLLILGLYIFTRCRLFKTKVPESQFFKSNEEEAGIDMFFFFFGFLVMYFGYSLISSFLVSVCILIVSVFIFIYLKNYYLYH